jgi:hypothetical protein
MEACILCLPPLSFRRVDEDRNILIYSAKGQHISHTCTKRPDAVSGMAG